MADGGGWAVGLLLDEAWGAYREGRYHHALAAAGRAVAAAEQLDDAGLLVRALGIEAAALQMLGDSGASLTRNTRILGLADDPAHRHRLGGEAAAWEVFRAHLNWVASARFLTGIPRRELFEVLDAAERWLTATGHPSWRAGVLLQRGSVHKDLGEREAALAAFEEALARYHPDAPGYTLATHRWELGDLLRDLGRHAEAEGHYRVILADAASGPFDRKVAQQGLAWCALAADDLEAACRAATAAVRLAEPLGDDILTVALIVLVAVARAAGDLPAAEQAATRHLEAAQRVGGHYGLYFAVRDALDVALDRGDRDTTQRLVEELDEHAAALDATVGNTTLRDEVERRRGRLCELKA